MVANNRYRLLTTKMSCKALAAILAHRRDAPWFSGEHVSDDGTRVEGRTSMSGFSRRQRMLCHGMRCQVIRPDPTPVLTSPPNPMPDRHCCAIGPSGDGAHVSTTDPKD